jgi:hypothetical protein
MTPEDNAYIQKRVAYALAAIDEMDITENNLAAIIGQEIGLAIQHERLREMRAEQTQAQTETAPLQAVSGWTKYGKDGKELKG